MINRHPSRPGFSLLEIVAAIVISAVVATIAITQFRKPGDTAHARGCLLTRQTLQNEVMRYIDETGSPPSTDLRQLNTAGFYDGSLPTCPQTGDALTLDRSGNVVCKIHP